MNKKYIVTDNNEIQKIIQTGKKKINKFFVIYYKDSKNSFNRYCISVSKKLGNAVTRNKLKRQLKDIIQKNTIKGTSDYVIIVRQELKDLSYQIKEKELLKILGENNEK